MLDTSIKKKYYPREKKLSWDYLNIDILLYHGRYR